MHSDEKININFISVLPLAGIPSQFSKKERFHVHQTSTEKIYSYRGKAFLFFKVLLPNVSVQVEEMNLNEKDTVPCRLSSSPT